MIVSEWVQIVKELQARGITDAVTIVAVLASYELPLDSGQMVLGPDPVPNPNVQQPPLGHELVHARLRQPQPSRHVATVSKQSAAVYDHGDLEDYRADVERALSFARPREADAPVMAR